MKTLAKHFSLAVGS